MLHNKLVFTNFCAIFPLGQTMAKICIKIGKLELFAETTNENPETEKRVLEQLPIKGLAQRWGEEIYFQVAFDIALQTGRQECELGEIGFWPDGPAIAIFFGKTPASTGSNPKAYSPCNFFARLSGNIDRQALNAVKDGEKIVVSRGKITPTYT